MDVCSETHIRENLLRSESELLAAVTGCVLHFRCAPLIMCSTVESVRFGLTHVDRTLGHAIPPAIPLRAFSREYSSFPAAVNQMMAFRFYQG